MFASSLELRPPLMLDGEDDDLAVLDDAPETPETAAANLFRVPFEHRLYIQAGFKLRHGRLS